MPNTTAGTGDGSVEEFKSMLVALIPALRGYAMSLTHNATEADDLVQESMLRAWRSRQTYAEGTNFKAWLFTIQRNAFLTSRGSKRRNLSLEEVGEARFASLPQQEWSIAYSNLISALKRLTPTTREALLLVVGSELSYEEAAAVCGVPTGTLKSRVSRARDQLAALLDVHPPARRAERAQRWPSAAPDGAASAAIAVARSR